MPFAQYTCTTTNYTHYQFEQITRNFKQKPIAAPHITHNTL